jgi:hypothetical protein
MRVTGGLLALMLLVTSPELLRAEVIVKQGLSRATVDMVSALLETAPETAKAPQVVSLSGDFGTDLDRLTRAASGEKSLVAVGPNATVLAGTVAQKVKDCRIVSIGVPNPERLKTRATYVSFYPPLDSVFRFLKTRFGARSVGLLYTPSQNAGIASAFTTAAQVRALSLVPVEVRSAGDLVRQLRPALARVDVLVVPVDPILFEPESFKILTDELRSSGKPAVGFLEELPRRGLTGALLMSREALARTAWQAAHHAPTADVLEVAGDMLYISAEGTAVVDLEKNLEPKPRK